MKERKNYHYLGHIYMPDIELKVYGGMTASNLLSLVDFMEQSMGQTYNHEQLKRILDQMEDEDI
jgi:hypothetical protein